MLRSVLAFSALALIAAPAIASDYSAKPAVPASGRIIARDIVWECGPAACQGATDESRPLVLCQSLAKRAGHIDSFVADGVALGVVGSPHFFTAAGGFFCPSLDVRRDAGGHLRVMADTAGFDRFVAACFD